MKKVFASIALSSICVFAQNEDVTSYDDAFFDEPSATVDVVPATVSNAGEVPVVKEKPSDVTVLEGLSVEDETEAETAPVDTKIKAESVKVLDAKVAKFYLTSKNNRENLHVSAIFFIPLQKKKQRKIRL